LAKQLQTAALLLVEIAPQVATPSGISKTFRIYSIY